MTAAPVGVTLSNAQPATMLAEAQQEAASTLAKEEVALMQNHEAALTVKQEAVALTRAQEAAVAAAMAAAADSMNRAGSLEQ